MGTRVGQSVAWAAAYAASVVLSRQLLSPESGLALFWPPAGIAVLWLLARRPRSARVRDTVLPALATAVALVAIGTSAVHVVGFVVANVVQPLAYLACWRRHNGELPRTLREAAPRSARDGVALIVCAAAASLAGSVVGVATAWAAGTPPSLALWSGWVVRNGSSIAILTLTVTAVVAGWHERRTSDAPPAAASRRWELLAAALVSAVVTLGVFLDPENRPAAFLSFVPALWIALRFSPAATAAHGLAQTVVALSLTVSGRGPFGGAETLADRALLVQGFLSLTVLLACLLSVSGTERARLVQVARAAEDRARDAAAAARARAALLEEVTASLQDTLLVVDRDGRVVLSNAPPEDARGPAFPDRLHLEQDSAADDTTTLDGRPFAPEERPSVRALAGERVPPVDVAFTDPASGQRRVLSVSASPVDPTGDPADRLAVMIARDVTADRAALEELRAFAGVVAHDLKNPLGAITGWVEVLEEQLATAQAGAATDTVQHIARTAERVHRLVDDLLQYARAGADELVVQRVRLHDVGQEALAFLDGAAEHVTLDHDADLEVDADPVLLRQVLVNLLANGVKYADGAPPAVRLHARDLGDRVEVEVVDNGVGIPADERDRVFEGFYRSSRTTDVPGTGLGLAICARTVRRHGGDIAADDAGPGGGTRISFWLPSVPQQDAPEDDALRVEPVPGPVLEEPPPVLPTTPAAPLADDTPDTPTPV